MFGRIIITFLLIIEVVRNAENNLHEQQKQPLTKVFKK